MSALPVNTATYYALADSCIAVRYINASGVDSEIWTAFCGIVCAMPLCFESARFALDFDRGESSIVIEVLADDGETTIDLVAWPIRAPTRCATAEGAAAVLGGWNIGNPATWAFGGALHVHRSPLAWLKAGCAGVVCLDYRRAAFELSQALGPIIAEDAAHAAELRRWLCRAPVDPKNIFYPLERAAA